MQLYPYGLALALLAAIPGAAFAQTHPQAPPAATLPPLVDSRQLLKEGIELHDKEDYDAALARYRAVTPGDTLYPAVQSELALTYLATKKYQEAVEAATRALSLRYFNPQTYINLAAAEEELKHPDKSQAAYDAGLKRFPYNQSLWFNQAVTQLEAKRFEAAFATIQRSVALKPAHASSHHLLANLAARQGQTSHAMLSLLAYLFVLPDGPLSHDILVELEQQASHAAVVEEASKIVPFTPNEAFRELDLLIDSKVALRKEYTSKVKFDAALVKQTQLLVEKFPTTAAPADDFWVRLYGPMVALLRQGDNLTTFTYLVLASADDKKVAQWIKGNKSKIEKLYATLTPALLQIRDQQPVTRDGKTVLTKAWYDGEGRVDGLGEGTLQGEERRFTGPWLLTDENGAVRQEGSYGADFKRTGPWRFYHANGQVERTGTYRNGELEGLVRDYHDNGQIATERPFVNGKLEGVMKVFSYCGELRETRSFKADALDGPYTELYPDGKTRLRVEARADKQEGPQTTFYPDGTKELEYTFVAGKKQGPFLVNYRDGTPEKRGTYDRDELHGAYTENFFNGQVENTGAFNHGKRTGAWKEYFPDGKLSAEKSYDEAGELHGTYRDYDYRGKLYSETSYEHGRVTRQRYYDPATGRIVHDVALKKGRVEVPVYGPEMASKGSGAYLNGQMDGEWRWNYANDQLMRLRTYKSGELSGPAEEYYANGQLRLRAAYANNVQEGPCEWYLRDGQRSQTGYYRAGQPQGPWRDYYADGQVSEEYEMHQGQKNGPARSFAPDGKLTELRVYEFGRRREQTTYDTLGQVLSHVVLRPDTKELTFAYPGGNVRYRTAVACYENQGPARWYHRSGKPEVEFSYAADKRHGPYKSYFQNGKTNLEGLYQDGETHGEWKEYYPSGQLRSSITYHYGSPVGEARYYFPNGQLETVYHYFYGALEGSCRYYNPQGELLEERLYERGALVGYRNGRDPAAPWQPFERLAGALKTTFANGKPAVEATVRNGVLDGSRTTYYSSGQVFRRISYQEGLRSGPLTSYYANGKPMEEEMYLHDERHGRCRYYRPDGTLERQETYRSGEKLGPTVYYNPQGQLIKTEVYWNQYVYEGK
jgi:antitoxin component YwqK of YwqJK toxin-antitoxin module/tetratricopeptide (TPR) repeat protein